MQVGHAPWLPLLPEGWACLPCRWCSPTPTLLLLWAPKRVPGLLPPLWRLASGEAAPHASASPRAGGAAGELSMADGSLSDLRPNLLPLTYVLCARMPSGLWAGGLLCVCVCARVRTCVCVCVCQGKDPQASVCRGRVPTPCPTPLTTFPCLDMMNICKEQGLQIRSLSQGFPGGSDGKESAHNAGDVGSIPGLGRSPGEGHGNPLQYSCLENPKDGGEWWATIHGVAKVEPEQCPDPAGNKALLSKLGQTPVPPALGPGWLSERV